MRIVVRTDMTGMIGHYGGVAFIRYSCEACGGPKLLLASALCWQCAVRALRWEPRCYVPAGGGLW